MSDDDFTVTVPGKRRCRVTVLTKDGKDFLDRYVWVFCSVPVGDAELIEKARAAFRRLYGERPRIVSVDVHCQQK